MLLNACMSAAPGQKECDNALRNIQVRFAIDDPVAFCWYCTLKQNLVFWVWFNHFFFHHVFAFLLLFFFVTVTDVIQIPRNQALWGLACVLRIYVGKIIKWNFFSNTIVFYHLLFSIFQHHFLKFELHYTSVLSGLKWIILLFLCRLWVTF